MSGQMLYLVGQPGSGKSTLMRAVLARSVGRARSRPFAMLCYPGGVVLGAERGTFSGTDALPMDVQPRVLRWLASNPCPVVVGEGDRLGNASFFDAVQDQGWDLHVVYLSASEELAALRRAARGSHQDPTWLAGRLSKVIGLRRYATCFLDASLPVPELAAELGAHPVMRALLGGGVLARRHAAWSLGPAFRATSTKQLTGRGGVLTDGA